MDDDENDRPVPSGAGTARSCRVSATASSSPTARLSARTADALHHRHPEADDLMPRTWAIAGPGEPRLFAGSSRLGPSRRHGCGRRRASVGVPLGRLAHHAFCAGRLGRAHRAGPDRAGHEMRLRRAGAHDPLHHHRRHRARPAYRSHGGPSLHASRRGIRGLRPNIFEE